MSPFASFLPGVFLPGVNAPVFVSVGAMAAASLVRSTQ